MTHRNQRQPGARIHDLPRRGVSRWAILLVGCHSEALVDPHAVVKGGGEGYCPAGVPVQAVFARASREELQSESTLVREHSMPVGSARYG